MEDFGGLSLRELGLVSKPEKNMNRASKTFGSGCLGAVGTFLTFLALFLLIADRFPPQGRELLFPEFHILYFLPSKRDFLSQIQL